MKEKNEKNVLTKMLRGEYGLRVIALVFLGAGINILFLGYAAWEFTQIFYVELVQLRVDAPVTLANNTVITLPTGTLVSIIDSGIKSPPTSFTLTLPIILLYCGYFAITLAYSTGISLIFKPKRFVSPFYIQIITIGFLAIVLVLPFIHSTNLLQDRELVNRFVSLIMVFGMFLFLAGMIQAGLVRRWIGLNEPLEPIHNEVKLFDVKFEDMKKIMTDEVFLSLGNFIGKKQSVKHRLVLESKQRQDEKLIFTLSPDETKEKSIVAAFAYEVVSNTIIPSKSANAWMESVFLFLEKVAKSLKPEDLDLKKSDAYLAALRTTYQNTKPRILEIVAMPRYQITTLIGTGVIFGILFAAWKFTDWIDDSAFITTLVLIGIELLVVFVPSMVEKTREERFEDQ